MKPSSKKYFQKNKVGLLTLGALLLTGLVLAGVYGNELGLRPYSPIPVSRNRPSLCPLSAIQRISLLNRLNNLSNEQYTVFNTIKRKEAALIDLTKQYTQTTSQAEKDRLNILIFNLQSDISELYEKIGEINAELAPLRTRLTGCLPDPPAPRPAN